MSPESRWPGGEHVFDPGEVDSFLMWAVEQGASDVSFQTRCPAFIEVDGVLRRATRVLVDGPAMELLCKTFFGETADPLLRGGDAIDTAHTVKRGRGEAAQRFRVNLSAVQVESAFAVNITMRVLPGAPPALDDLGIEDEVAEPWRTCRGLTLVTGVPGSGKSTLLAAGTRNLLETGAGRVQSLESPIEFVFDGIGGDEALMSQSDIPEHFPDFKTGLRACLRRRPAAVIVGEARDLETVEAVIRAADFGIAVYTTTHTIGVAATMRRLLAEFPVAERAERGAAFVDVLNVVVSQMLLPSPGGGRHALREWLSFGSGLKAALLDAPQERWTAMIAAALAETGNHFRAAAERAFADGRIGEADLRRISAAHAEAKGGRGDDRLLRPVGEAH